MTIRLWNTKRLVDELVHDQVKERDAFAYFVANSVLWTLMSYYASLMGARLGWMFLYEVAVVLVITVFGLYLCYGANGGASGHQFVLRATCLSFPIGLKVNIASILLGWVDYFYFYRIVDPITFHDPTRIYILTTFLWAAAFAALFYWRLWHHLVLIQRQQVTNLPLNPDTQKSLAD